MCAQYMEAEAITEAVVVAHSVSGVWLQLLLGQVPERISRVCFLNAIVLKTGESFISNAVGPAQVIFPPCTDPCLLAGYRLPTCGSSYPPLLRHANSHTIHQNPRAALQTR